LHLEFSIISVDMCCYTIHLLLVARSAAQSGDGADGNIFSTSVASGAGRTVRVGYTVSTVGARASARAIKVTDLSILHEESS
jgi:hypothetical protein